MNRLEFHKGDLISWAELEGRVWPCSRLKCVGEDDVVMVEFDETGLVDFDCPEWVQLNAVDEINAFIEDVIHGRFVPKSE